MTTDLIQHLFTLPSEVQAADRWFKLELFINHPGYDFRIGYVPEDASLLPPPGWKHPLGLTTGFLWLIENIASEDDLRMAIDDTRQMLLSIGCALIDPAEWQ